MDVVRPIVVGTVALALGLVSGFVLAAPISVADRKATAVRRPKKW